MTGGGDTGDTRLRLVETLQDAEHALERMKKRRSEAACDPAALDAAKRGQKEARVQTAGASPRMATPVRDDRFSNAEGAPSMTSPAGVPRTLTEIREELGDCTRCKLHAGRTNIVFGVGNAKAELMFVGEGPGADEDAKGEPFVGRAGQLLTKMIEAMGVTRADVYIANVVKCRPPENRAPAPDEVASCSPFLRAQIRSIRPRVIVTLGNAATSALLGRPEGITRLRGVFHDFDGTMVMPTYHPAFLLRSPQHKKDAWNDLQQVMSELGWKVPEKSK